MNQPTTPCRPGGSGARGAFTLVELLVVVAILALLVSILVPTLAGAKETARQTICLTNQSAIIKALQAYHGDFSSYPYNYADYVADSWWGTGFPDVDYGQWEVAYLDALGTRTAERMALGCIARYLGAAKDKVNFWNAQEKRFPAAYVCPSADLATIYSTMIFDKYHASYWTNMAVRLNLGYAGRHGGGLFTCRDGTTPKPPGDDAYLHTGPSCGRAWVTGACKTVSGGQTCPARTIFNPAEETVASLADTVFSGDTNDETLEAATYCEAGHRICLPGNYHQAMAPGWHGGYVLLGFQRHRGRLPVSYLDGHCVNTSKDDLRARYATDGKDGVAGDFLIKYDERQSCTPATFRKHWVPTAKIN